MESVFFFFYNGLVSEIQNQEDDYEEKNFMYVYGFHDGSRNDDRMQCR